MSDLSGRLSGSQAISGSLSGGSVLRGGLSMGGGVSPELLLDKADVITDTASGSIVSIPDGMASPVLGLDVDIEPIQDLHGYDNPWPAGGGKNKWNPTGYRKVGSVFSLDGDTYTMSWTNGSLGATTENVQTFESGSWSISATGTNVVNVMFYIYNADTHGTISIVRNGSGSFTASAPFFVGIGGYYNAPGTAEFKVQLEAGGTATPYAPYSNLCPISGRSEVNVYVEETYDAQATPKATIQLGQTVYGGTVDVTEGKLVIDRAFVSVSTAQGKTENENGYFWYSTTTALSIPLIKGLNAKLISDRFRAIANTTVSEVDGVISFYANGIIRWKEKGDLDVSAYNSYLASNPFQLCYELATPVEVTLTAEELDILYGDNFVFADSGNVSVSYRCDTKKYILKKIAEALNA